MSTETEHAHDRQAEQPLGDIIRFHGHMCPGLAMGIRASEIALREIGPHSRDEDVVAVVETDMCAVDAIQYQTGCTFGKGNLIHLDHGKNAYTFLRRSDGRAIRIATRPGMMIRNPEHSELMSKVREGTATGEERERFAELHEARSREILAAAEDELYDVREVDGVEIAPRAFVHISIQCAECGEPTMETRIGRFKGRELCPPCFAAAISGRRGAISIPGSRSDVAVTLR
ncbi:MAG: FmdE family protein [Thermoleophilia bacterium]